MRTFLASVALAAGILSGTSASAQLYGIGPWKKTVPNPPTLYRFDPDTGAGTPIGRVFPAIDTVGMTWDGQRLLMATEQEIYEIDPETGDATFLQSLGPLDSFGEGAIAADPDTGILYLRNRTTFGTIDLNTGEVTVVFEDSNGLDLSGMTLDANNNLLALSLNGPTSRLFEVDRDTGLLTTSAQLPMPLNIPNVTGMAYDSTRERVFATAAGSLFDITDPSAPVAIGAMGIDSVAGLAYIPEDAPCPADIAPPFGILDLVDIDTFITAFTTGGSDADVATPFGVLDLADVDAFIISFLDGCP